jgi:hypothetical protein
MYQFDCMCPETGDDTASKLVGSRAEFIPPDKHNTRPNEFGPTRNGVVGWMGVVGRIGVVGRNLFRQENKETGPGADNGTLAKYRFYALNWCKLMGNALPQGTHPG